MMNVVDEIREANAYADAREAEYFAEARERVAAARNVYQLLSLQIEDAVRELDALQFIAPNVTSGFLARVLVEALQDFESATAKEAREIG